MIQRDKSEFLRILIGLQAVKPSKELTTEAITIWWETFAPSWGIEEFKRAAIALNLSCEFMPNAAHFARWRRDQVELQHPSATEAWEIAVKHCSSSAYRSGPIADPAIDLAVTACGGYLAIAMCEQPHLHFLERRFTEHYKSLRDISQAREQAGIQAPKTPNLRVAGPKSVADLLSAPKRDQ